VVVDATAVIFAELSVKVGIQLLHDRGAVVHDASTVLLRRMRHEENWGGRD
jgi:hypothetical protein